MQGFEKFLSAIVRGAGCLPQVEVVSPKSTEDSFTYVKWGESEGRRIVFVFSPSTCDMVHLKLKRGFFASTSVKDLISGERISITETDQGQECRIKTSDWGINVLAEE